MSDEPIFCTHCGAEDLNCECSQEQQRGPYCDICGVIPRPGGECSYMRRGGLANGCLVADLDPTS